MFFSPLSFFREWRLPSFCSFRYVKDDIHTVSLDKTSRIYEHSSPTDSLPTSFSIQNILLCAQKCLYTSFSPALDLDQDSLRTTYWQSIQSQHASSPWHKKIFSCLKRHHTHSYRGHKRIHYRTDNTYIEQSVSATQMQSFTRAQQEKDLFQEENHACPHVFHKETIKIQDEQMQGLIDRTSSLSLSSESVSNRILSPLPCPLKDAMMDKQDEYMEDVIQRISSLSLSSENVISQLLTVPSRSSEDAMIDEQDECIEDVIQRMDSLSLSSESVFSQSLAVPSRLSEDAMIDEQDEHMEDIIQRMNSLSLSSESVSSKPLVVPPHPSEDVMIDEQDEHMEDVIQCMNSLSLSSENISSQTPAVLSRPVEDAVLDEQTKYITGILQKIGTLSSAPPPSSHPYKFLSDIQKAPLTPGYYTPYSFPFPSFSLTSAHNRASGLIMKCIIWLQTTIQQ